MSVTPADNHDVHPSVTRLLEDAIQATAHLPSNRRVRSMSDLRRMLDVSHQTLGNWKSRGISTEGALKAELLFGIPASRLLHLVAVAGEPPGTWMPPQRANAGDASDAPGQSRPVRLLGQDSVPLYNRESLMQAKDLPARFRIELDDAALTPELHPGDELYIDRELEPQPGDLALLADPQGQLLVRVLRLRLPGQWIAAAFNPSFADLNLAADHLRIVGVVYGEMRRRRRSVS